MRELPNANRRLDEYIRRALNKVKKPSTAEEITELLNRDLGPGDRPFQAKEVVNWLRTAGDLVAHCRRYGLSYVLASEPSAQLAGRVPASAPHSASDRSREHVCFNIAMSGTTNSA